MRELFIEARWTGDITPVIEKAIKIIPDRVGLITTVQHKHELKKIKRMIEKAGKRAVIGGQVLGCDINAAKKIEKKVDAFLFIGSGGFHPFGLAMKLDKKIIIADPLLNEVREITKEDVEIYKKKEKGALIKFLSSKEIGIIVSTKPGQAKLEKAFELKKKLKDKNCYIFVGDTIREEDLENFPFIECWVNTACPRFSTDKKSIIDYELVEKNL